MFYEVDEDGNLTHPFFQEVLYGFKRVAAAEGYDVLLFTNTPGRALVQSYEHRARARGVDGVALMGVRRTSPDLEALAASRIPCMSVDLDLLGPRAGYVSSTNVEGAVQAVEYLIAMQHRNIAFIGDRFATKPGHDRLIGYQQTLQRHGLAFRPEWVCNGDFSEDSGYESARRLLAEYTEITAIFCAGDMMAIGAMRAIAERGLAVGEDISVIGYDDLPVAAATQPPLTTVRQERRKLGEMAAQALIQMIQDPYAVPPVLQIPTELVVRQSVAVCRKAPVGG
ncbi:LacI family transcriptional regulator [Alicyclobacillus cellulosilyticus]|uniref:LacI family transcriptional regulator n=1 Tax=Alicyclobacillus cellulosilyticus TaxID=1003997 RepID=A0A917K1Z6_9BACL|nr:substrate-binding domain-containing protein [Alicyclobacillus cellulosilyticus]GGI97791.1 LacI family transcriptional regulator [Alicyclobacillus cellulosilyticus]